MRTEAFGLVVCALLLAGCSGSTASTPEPYDNWYPSDITPPEGTKYPCALEALPPEMEGIPAADHRYINHVYSQLLRATQAKLVLFRKMSRPDQARQALADYNRETGNALAKIDAEPVPRGLGSFQRDVTGAIELQRAFFAKATDHLARGGEWKAMFEIPEGHQASGKLIAAWNKMQSRYADWPEATKDSIYHHLCALDLF